MGLNDSLVPYSYSNFDIDMSLSYGYAPRYAELKSAKDYFEGGFCGSYASWVTGYDEAFLNLWRRGA